MFITSDLHFGHKKIIEYCSRPFSSVEEMDNTIIKNWNNLVGTNQTIFIVGDFSFHRDNEITKNICNKLNGNKILITGNHDRLTIGEYRKFGFTLVKDYLRVKYKKHVFILSHYPMLTWHGAHRGSIMLHGHCHNNSNINKLNSETRRMDIGTDCNNFTPFSFDEIINIMNDRKYNPVDHHGENIEL